MTRFRVIHLVFAVMGAFTAYVSAEKKANCTKPEGPAMCCVDYFLRDDGLCHPCENGTHGVNCNFRCPRFHYGRFCQEKCYCSSGMDCDPRNGKCNLDHSNSDDNVPFPIWIIVLASVGVIVLLVGLLGCCLAFQRSRQSKSGKDFSSVHDILDLLARRASPPEPESNNYRETTTDTSENCLMDTNNDNSCHYIDTDTSLLDINPMASNMFQVAMERKKEDLDHCDSDKNIPTGKACSCPHTLPIKANVPPFFGTVEMYHSTENLAQAYHTLTRCGTQKADVPPSSCFLKKNLEHWTSEKPSGFVKVRKWRNKQREAIEDNSSRNDVERRRKSRALSNLRKGITSAFRSSKGSLEINSNANDGSNRDEYMYSVVQHPQDTCSTGGNLREECNLAIMNIDANHCNIRNQSIGNTAEATGGQLPPPPDEWLSENCSAKLCDGYNQENGDD